MSRQRLATALAGAARRAPFVLLGLAGFAGLVVLLYFSSVHLRAGNSDKATTLLEGQSLRNGNLLLHGWYLPLDSYWTGDAPVFALLVLLVGVRPQDLALEPALMAAAVIVAGVLMVRAAVTRPRARTAASVAGAVTVLVPLAFPPYAMATRYLANGFHVSTALWALVAFALVADQPRTWPRLHWRLAAGTLALTAGLLGDLQMLAYGVVPVLLAGLVAMARRRSWRRGAGLVGAAAGSVLLAEAVRRVVVALGGFATGPPLPFARGAQMLANLRHLAGDGGDLLGLTHRLGTGGAPAALADVRAVGGILLLGSTVLAAARLAGGAARGSARGAAGEREVAGWFLDDLLLLATFGVTAIFVGTALTDNPNYIRYLDDAVVFMAVLAGRTMARAVQSAAARRRTLPRAAAAGLAAAGVAVSLAYASAAGYLLAGRAPAAPPRALGAWLAAHGLHDGVADYWAASITTVDSAGSVMVRPVASAPDGRLGRMLDQSSASWYGGRRFQFLVCERDRFDRVDAATAARTFGNPVRTYSVDGYEVLVWPQAITVAPYPGVAPHP